MRPALLAAALLAFVLALPRAALAADPKECEVCMDVLALLDAKLPKDKRGDMSFVEEQLGKVCGDPKHNEQRKKLCYFVDPIKREVSQLMKNGLPNDKICKRLSQKSREICSVRYAVAVEKGVTDYNALKVKDLKKILADRGVVCEGCSEKAELVAKCQATEHLEGSRKDGL